MIDPRSHVPTYLQLAGYFRDRIRSEQLAPGERLPSEAEVQEQTGLSRSTIRTAMRTLREEGLIVIRPPKGTFVRARRPTRVVRLGPGDQAEVRTPTEVEQCAHDLRVTEMVLDIRRSDGRCESGPAEGTHIVAGDVAG